jgi:membrane-bound ClpP family serine protease
VVVAGFGILGMGAIVSLMVGGLLLFTQFGDSSPTMPSIGVSKWMLSGSGGVAALTLAYVIREAYLSRKQGPPEKIEQMAGMVGTVTGELAPRGIVFVGNETWTAISEDDSVISVGEAVEVRSVDGLILTVFRQSDPDKADNS